jgi:hypothetical protein
MYLDIPYALPHEELNQLRRIIRAYTRQIDALSLEPMLLRRKIKKKISGQHPRPGIFAHSRRPNIFHNHRN